MIYLTIVFIGWGLNVQIISGCLELGLIDGLLVDVNLVLLLRAEFQQVYQLVGD